ncbi:uncharacterized protein [Littorina saxatilis]|uniref:Uncharacterized protein n=1 Tax=Littorina saxatilis TaxID=31220 RepID=A0AAN9ALK4_9CAEN
MMTSQLAAFAILALLSLVGGQPPPPPKRCCLPDQWSSVMSDLSTINSATLGLMSLQYDYKQQKQSMVSVTNDPVTKAVNVTARTVIDFARKEMYYLPMNDPSKCMKSPYPIGAVQCVPDNATYLGSTYLGPMGGPLTYDGWRFQLPGGPLFVTLGVTRDGCVPLVEGVTTPGKPQNDKLFLFTAYQPKIANPDDFNLPASCL